MQNNHNDLIVINFVLFVQGASRYSNLIISSSKVSAGFLCAFDFNTTASICIYTESEHNRILLLCWVILWDISYKHQEYCDWTDDTEKDTVIFVIILLSNRNHHHEITFNFKWNEKNCFQSPATFSNDDAFKWIKVYIYKNVPLNCDIFQAININWMHKLFLLGWTIGCMRCVVHTASKYLYTSDF